MDRAVYLPWIGIKSKTRRLVKVLLLCLLAVFPDSSAHAKKSSALFGQEDTDTFPIFKSDDSLPTIKARTYEVKVVRPSNSKRLYHFQDLKNAKPQVGRILLLKRGEEAIMAFRVLQTHADRGLFFAKRVRRYGPNVALNDGETLTVIERVVELDPPPPPPVTPEDAEEIEELEKAADASASDAPTAAPISTEAPALGDPTDLPSAARAGGDENKSSEDLLKDLSGSAEDKGDKANKGAEERSPDSGGPLPETLAYDPELDAGTSPDPDGGSTDGPESDGSGDPDREIAFVDEVEPLDINRHWLSVEFGMFRALNPNHITNYWGGGGLRYGLSLAKQIFFNKSKLQDSFAVESGAFFYKVLNFVDTGDAYSVVPLDLTFRYNIQTSDTFGFFFYAGLEKNVVTASSQSTPEGTAALSTPYIAAGGGLIIHLGPNWDARVDAGSDMLGAGLMLRF